MKKLFLLLGVGLAVITTQAQAELQVFTCEPEWASLVQELTGGKAEIYSATTAFQDPHHIEARPSLIAKLRRADLLVCTGAGLESGWLPLLLRQSANAKVQPGQAGYFEAAQAVVRLDIPQQVDRRQGDIHAEGNPHVHLDPNRIAIIARDLAERLAKIDPANAVYFQQQRNAFLERWKPAIYAWQAKAAPLKDIPVAVYHRDFVYLFHWLGIQQLIMLEPKPGIPPSAGYLADIKDSLAKQPVKLVLYTSYQNDRAPNWLGQAANVPVVQLPYTVGGSDKAADLFGLFDDIITKLLSATTK